jgi:hypothetical protein
MTIYNTQENQAMAYLERRGAVRAGADEIIDDECFLAGIEGPCSFWVIDREVNEYLGAGWRAIAVLNTGHKKIHNYNIMPDSVFRLGNYIQEGKPLYKIKEGDEGLNLLLRDLREERTIQSRVERIFE